MLATHNRRGTKRSQTCTGKARHHDEVARLGHVTAIVASITIVGIGIVLTAAIVIFVVAGTIFVDTGIFLVASSDIGAVVIVLGTVGLVVLLLGVVLLLLRTRTLIRFGLFGFVLGFIVLRVVLRGIGFRHGVLTVIVLVRRRVAAWTSHQRPQRGAKHFGNRGLLVRRGDGRIRPLIRIILRTIGTRSGNRTRPCVSAGVATGRGIARTVGRFRRAIVGRAGVAATGTSSRPVRLAPIAPIVISIGLLRGLRLLRSLA